jgi:acyl carrier protein
MNTTDIAQRIKKTIVQCLELDISPSDIGDDTLLFAPASSGGMELDSLAAIEIVVGIGHEFSLQLDEVPRETFRSVSTLADFVSSSLKLAAA